MYADPKRRNEILAANRAWKRKNRKRVIETHQRWLRTTSGQKHRIGLPVAAPDGLLESIHLLRALIKEIRNREHQ